MKGLLMLMEVEVVDLEGEERSHRSIDDSIDTQE